MSEINYQSINVGTEKISGFNELTDSDYEKTKSIKLKKAIIVPFIISTFVGSSPEINGIHSEPFKLEQNSSSVMTYGVPTKKAYREIIGAPGRVIIDVGELMEHNKEKMKIIKEERLMYETIINGIVLFEKIGISFGIFFALFIVTLPLYTSLSWFLAFGGASCSALISLFLYKLIRGLDK